MSIWSMPSDASASRMALIMVCGAAMQPAWPAPLTPRGLTVVGCWASVTSVTGARHRVVHQRAAQQLAGSLGADCAFEQPVPDTPGRSTHDRIRREDRGSYRWWPGLDDPDQMFYENYSCGSERNYTGYCNAEVDKLMDQQSAETDVDKRRQIVW